MGTGIKLKDVGDVLTKSEYHDVDALEIISGSSFPVGPSAKDLYYRSDLNAWFQHTGSEWRAVGEPHTAADYVIWKEGSNYLSRNGSTGQVESNTSLKTILQNAHDALTSGGVIYIKKLSYTESSSLPILAITNDYIRVTGDFPTLTVGNNVMSSGSHGWAIIWVQSSNVEIDHLILGGNGANQSYTPIHAENEGLIDIWKYHWDTADIYSTSRENDVSIHHCIIQNAYNAGVTFMKFDRVKIYKNIILYSHYSDKKNIWGAWSYDSEIEDNYCDIYTSPFGTASNNIHLRPAGNNPGVNSCCRRVRIEGNWCLNSADCPIEVQGREEDLNYHEDIQVVNNFVMGAAIMISKNVRNVTVARNTIVYQGQVASPPCTSCIQISAMVNDVDCKLIHVDIIDNIMYTDADATQNPTYGIYVASTANGTVSDLKIQGNHIHGIENGVGIGINGGNSSNFNNIHIRGNDIHDNNTHGISIINTPSGCTITIDGANHIYNNGSNGIDITGDGNFSILSNDIYDDQGAMTQDNGINLNGAADYGRILGNRIKSITGLSIAAGNDNWFVDGNDFYGCTTDVSDSSGPTTEWGGNRNQAGTYVHEAEP